MGPFLSLVSLCTAMGLSTFLFGLLPLTLRLSRLTLRILEVGGAGLLLGAACSVVMPEGAGTLFREVLVGEQSGHEHEHHRRSDMLGRRHESEGGTPDPENWLAVSFLTGVLVMFIIDQIMAPGAHVHGHPHDPPHQTGASRDSYSHPRPKASSDQSFRRLTRPETLILTRSSGVLTASELAENQQRAKASKDGTYDAAATPIATILPNVQGSLFTQVQKDQMSSKIDKTSSRDGSPSSDGSLPADYETFPQDDGSNYFRNPPPPRQSSTSADTQGQSSYRPHGSSPSSPLLRESPPASPSLRRHRSHLSTRSHASHHSDLSESGRPKGGLRSAFTSILGLIIHAACDGIAMGASSASKDEGLKLVVVGAIMIHKAPAAFGLCTLLLSQRLTKADIRRVMGVFSLATPVGAIATYLLLSFFVPASPASQSMSASPPQPHVSALHVGAALTFSAGSFLYVAMDACHELASHSADVETITPAGGQGGEGEGEVNERMTLGRWGRISVLLLGAVLPRSLQMVFGHGH